MEHNDKATPECICKSVFKDGATTTSKVQFTKMWIELINKIERGKSLQLAQQQ